MTEIDIICDEDNIRLDAWVAGKLNEYSRTYIQKLIDDGNITVEGKTVKSNHKLKTGQKVHVTVPEPVRLDVKPEDIDIDILYEDDDIIVVNKPKGMVVNPAAGNYTGTLVNALMSHCGDCLSDINGVIRPGIVHRIDKDTSGILVVAKNNTAHEKLSQKLKEHDIERIYIALVDGNILEDKGKIDAPIGRHPNDRKKMAVNTKNGKRAVTHFKVLERFNGYTLVELKLETGRTHQIRVHMSFIGHPVVGDEVYNNKKSKSLIKGQALHAKVLGFEHPLKKEYMRFEAEIPEYFQKLLEDLRKK